MANPPPIRLSIEGEDRTRAAWQSAIGSANSAARSITSSMKAAFGGIGALSVVGVTAGFSKIVADSINLGDQLAALKGKTGIAGTALLELKYAAEQSDVSFDSLGDGLIRLRRTIGDATSGSKEAAAAFQRVGISVAQLRGQGVEEVFATIADRLAGMTDENRRASVANDLLGKSYADLLPLLARGSAEIGRLRDQSKLMGDAISEDDIERLAQADDAINNLKTSFSRLGLTVGGVVAGPLAAFSNWLAFGGGDPGDALQNRIEDVTGEIRMLKRELETNVDGRDGFAKRLKDAQARYAALLAQQQKLLGVGAAGAQPLPIPEVLVTAKRPNATAEKAAAAAAVAQRQKYLADLKAAQELTRTNEEKLLADIQGFLAALDKLRAAKPSDGGITAEQRDERLLEYLKGRLPKAPTIEKADEDMKKAGDSFKETVRGMSVYADEAARGMQQAFANFLFDPFRNGLKGMLRDFLNVIRRMLAEAAAAKIMEALTGGGSKTSKGGGNFFTDLLGGLLGGGGSKGGGTSSPTGIIGPGDLPKFPTSMSLKGYARGGDYSGLEPIVVGDGGQPEVLWPKTPGRVLPSVSGGGLTVHMNTNVDARGASDSLTKQLPMILAENNRQMVQLVKQSLADDRSRGRT